MRYLFEPQSIKIANRAKEAISEGYKEGGNQIKRVLGE
jgi:hypothetical protein